MPAGLSTLLALLGQTFGSGEVVMPNEVGGYDDNIIRLGGQNLPVRGTSVAEQVSEFEAGLKIGPATYDNREHAFFIVMNDFSAGMGTRFIDVREELGGFWAPEKENAVDTSRAKYLILPPKQTTVQDTAPTVSPLGQYTYVSNAHLGLVTTVSSFYVRIVHGSGIYSSLDAGYTFTKEYDLGATTQVYTAIAEMIPKNLASRGGYFFIVAAPNGNYQWTGAYNAPWGPDALVKGFDDLMWWDGKILAISSFGIEFGIVAVDPDTYEVNITWNIENPLDGEYVASIFNNGSLRFAGVAMSPWGQPSPYFHNASKLFVLDFFARKFYPIEFGLGREITGTSMWNGALQINDGFNVWEYSPGSTTVRNIGLDDKQGMPPNLLSENGGAAYRMRMLIPADTDLYAIANAHSDLTTSPRSILLKYNGKGWHQVGAPLEYWAMGGLHTSSRYPSDRRSIIVWGTADPTTDASAGMYHTIYELPTHSNTPLPGRDNFGASGASFTGGWMNGGFHDIDGTLLRLKIDAQYLTTTETVKVEFQLDGDEDSDWVQLVDKNNTAQVFDSSHDTLYFSTDPDGDVNTYQPRKGIVFNSVRFRITLNRGSDATLSPVVKALILMYIKVPDFRLAMTFTVDVNRMLEENTDTVYYVDGAEATLRNVHQKLISLWNEHVLHQLIVPNVVTEADNVYVRIVGMPLRFQDFKDSVAGRGTIELSLIEPLERVT